MPLLLDNDAIKALLEPAELVDAIERAYTAYARGDGVSAPRQDVQAEPAGRETYQLGTVAGITGRYAALRIKSDVTFLREIDGVPRKEKYAVEPGLYCGLVLLLSVETGAPLALMHDGYMQQMRVGADSAIGARLMARSDSNTLGLLGSGGMAMSHLRTIGGATSISSVRVYSPTESHAERLADIAREMGFDARALRSGAAVAAEADILCACTNATGPVVFGEDLRPGTHVMAIGGALDDVASARVDRWLRLGLATAAPEWGGQPIEEECITFSASGKKAPSGGTRSFGAIPTDRRILLSELLADPQKGRISDEQITFSDRGNIHGVQFAATAGYIYEKAVASGAGREMPLSDFTQTIRN